MYKTDSGGFAFGSPDLKLSYGASTWATKLSQLARQPGTVRIATYSLPDMEYVRTQLGRRPWDIWLIANMRFYDRALEVKRAFPQLRVAVNPQTHAKFLLIEPRTLWLGSP